MPIEFEDEDYSPSELAPLLKSASSGATPAHASGTPITLTVPLSLAGKRLDQGLAELFPEHSRSRLTAMLKDGAILLDGAAVAAKTKLLGGEIVVATLRPRDEETAFTPEDLAIEVVYEDEAIVVINKPAGMVVHPAAGNWHGTLLNALLFRYPDVAHLPRAGIVHRLDKDTTGIMVAAKTEAAQLSLVRQLQARSMKRIYLALVRGDVARDGKVDAPIMRHPRDRTRMAVVGDVLRGESNVGKPAVTHYRPLQHFSYHTLVECSLETGRTHQIRVHMQTIGFPLEADPVYGPPPAKMDAEVRDTFRAFARQALHAKKLTLSHPVTNQEMTFEVPLPDDMADLLDFVATL
jgi:23S rRNA pseudouridine1911/1915/1917 synthase